MWTRPQFFATHLLPQLAKALGVTTDQLLAWVYELVIVNPINIFIFNKFIAPMCTP